MCIFWFVYLMGPIDVYKISAVERTPSNVFDLQFMT